MSLTLTLFTHGNENTPTAITSSSLSDPTKALSTSGTPAKRMLSQQQAASKIPKMMQTFSSPTELIHEPFYHWAISMAVRSLWIRKLTSKRIGLFLLNLNAEQLVFPETYSSWLIEVLPRKNKQAFQFYRDLWTQSCQFVCDVTEHMHMHVHETHCRANVRFVNYDQK